MESVSDKVELANYYFSGLEASQIGALKSVLNYYQAPVSASWIYGMTGIAFLTVHDQTFLKPNAGPPDSDLFRLARNIGLQIEGTHTYAENERFRELQLDMWNKAREAIGQGYPVFAKNIDIENQTSVIYGYDSAGYYTYSWHGGEGHDHADDVIPWDKLGKCYCPCSYCRGREENQETNDNRRNEEGLISLHWAALVPAADPRTAFQAALEYLIALNDRGTIRWHNETLFIGEQAYLGWIQALEQNRIDKYWFSLTLEPIADARSHAVLFLREVKHLDIGVSSERIDEALEVYTKIAGIYKYLVQKFPYEQPREWMEDADREESVTLLKQVMQYEKRALDMIKAWYEDIKAIG